MKRSFFAILSVVALLAASATGCSNSKYDWSQVKGTVKVGGVPVKESVISFVQVEGKAPAVGGRIVDGQYSVKVPSSAGEMKVSIGSPPDVPEKYNLKTELRLQPEGSTMHKDFDL